MIKSGKLNLEEIAKENAGKPPVKGGSDAERYKRNRAKAATTGYLKNIANGRKG